MNRRAFLALLPVMPFLKRAKPMQPKPTPLAFHPDAFAFVMADLPLPEHTVWYRYEPTERAMVKIQ